MKRKAEMLRLVETARACLPFGTPFSVAQQLDQMRDCLNREGEYARKEKAPPYSPEDMLPNVGNIQRDAYVVRARVAPGETINAGDPVAYATLDPNADPRESMAAMGLKPDRIDAMCGPEQSAPPELPKEQANEPAHTCCKCGQPITGCQTFDHLGNDRYAHMFCPAQPAPPEWKPGDVAWTWFVFDMSPPGIHGLPVTELLGPDRLCMVTPKGVCSPLRRDCYHTEAEAWDAYIKHLYEAKQHAILAYDLTRRKRPKTQTKEPKL